MKLCLLSGNSELLYGREFSWFFMWIDQQHFRAGVYEGHDHEWDLDILIEC